MTANPPPESHLTVHILKVTLLDVSPPVFRIIRVPSVVTLASLHPIIQTAMGWEGIHLHEWTIDGRTYASREEDDWGEDFVDESTAVLADAAGADDAFHYEYDLGNGWDHLVEVLRVEPYDATVPPVAVLEGSRSAPPEDSGGPEGYEHLLDALSDPADEEHEEMLIWAGEGFDPTYFDRTATNRRLESFWRPRE